MNTKTIPSLFGLRAVSILMVVFFHSQHFFRAEDRVYVTITNIFNGDRGVNFFFVISGFLITTLLIREYTQNKEISLPKFYMRRVFRIFPAYYAILLFYLILQLSGLIFIHSGDWIASIFYLRQFWGRDILTGHFWSLSVEEFFYLISPFLFSMIYFRNPRIFGWMLMAATFIIIPLIRIATHFGMIPTINEDFNILVRGDALTIGCLLAIYYPQISARIRLINWLVFIIPVLLVIQWIAVDNIPLNVFRITPVNYWVPFGHRGCSLFDNIYIAILIVYCIERKDTIIFRILNSSVAQYVGVLSYSIYLYQAIFTKNGLIKGVPMSFPLNLLVIFVFAWLSYRFVEKPFLKLKDKFAV